MTNKPHDIVPAHLAVQAMRDNGYKNAAYAIAELMDNAIQAGATQVELLCGERREIVGQRRRSRIHQIAVLDNGRGMDAAVLRLALQFGNGTYLEEDKHTGIGRFGMGLPSSSISQCERVDVWSWQDGVENALYTYLDLEEIRRQRLTEVPEPKLKAVPKIWREVGERFGQTGTLVVWSRIDRCVWKTGAAIIDNSELIIGRMYRRFLDKNNISIKMLAFDFDNLDTVIVGPKYALPNDPGYLIEKTSCPAPFDSKSMFQPWAGENEYECTWSIEFRERKHEIKVRFSYAKEEARILDSGRNAGDEPYGKHAKRNVGVSVVRAGRELELDETPVIKYDPVERWWGIEVEFPPSLDDLFGVTNNKQAARNFAELLKLDMESLLKGGKSISQLKEEFEYEEDPRGPLLEIAQKIYSQLSIIRRLLKTQTKGSRSQNRRHMPVAERAATAATEDRKREGHIGQSDQGETKSLEVRKSEIKETLEEQGLAESQAQELAARTINDGLKYTFAEADLETSAFFSVKPRGGAIIVTLNTNHPAYDKLVEVMEKDTDNVDADILRTRLNNSLEGLKLLLMAWARYEDEQPDGKRRNAAQDTRTDWGRIARQFLELEE